MTRGRYSFKWVSVGSAPFSLKKISSRTRNGDKDVSRNRYQRGVEDLFIESEYQNT